MKFNAANAQRVIDWIEANPERWCQTSLHYGTTHCFAGVAQILSGKKASVIYTTEDACAFLGLPLVDTWDGNDAGYLFAPWRTLPELKERIRLLAMEANGHE